MTPKQLMDHFKTQAAAGQAIGVGQSAVANWVKRGHIPPLSQIKFEQATGGRLKADKKIFGTPKVSQR
jgi:hypothetical protein